MDVFASKDGFGVGLMARFKYKWDKKSGGLLIWSEGKGPDYACVSTHSGVFVEAVKDGATFLTGGDGNWLYVPLSKKPVTLRRKTLPAPKLSAKEMDKHRNTVTRYLVSDAPYSLDIPEKMTELISWMQGKLKEIPAPCRASASLRFDTTMEYGETYPRIEITYTQPETDDEVIFRLQVQAERDRIKEASDRAKLAELNQKYAPTVTP